VKFVDRQKKGNDMAPPLGLHANLCVNPFVLLAFLHNSALSVCWI